MESATAQLAALKEARVRETERRDARRLWRSRYLSNQQEDRYYQSRRALQRDLRRHAQITSLAEQQLLAMVRQTASWWDALCDHSIEQKLQSEIAERDKKTHHASYLENVQQRETRELMNLMESDARRWDLVREQYQDNEAALRREAVDEAITSVVASVGRCIEYLGEYSLSGNDNILAQFALREIPLAGSNGERPAASAMEIFEAIYGRPQLPRSCAAFLELLKLLYLASDSTEEKKTSLFEVTPVPLVAINGPVFSGKSILASELVSRHGFQSLSDRGLVQKALDVYRTEKDAIEAFELFSKKQEDDALADAPALAAAAAAAAADDKGSAENATHDDEGETKEETQEKKPQDDQQEASGPASAPPGKPLQVPASATSPTQQLTPSYSAPGSAAGSGGYARAKRLSMIETPSRGGSQGRFQLSARAQQGQRIHELLLSGKAIDSSLIAQLVLEELREIVAGGSADGGSAAAAATTTACKGVLLDGIVTRPEEYRELHRSLLPQQLSRFTEVMRVWCGNYETNELKRAKVELGDEDPTVPVEWLITKASLEEPAGKKEAKPRSSKKNVDMSTLPPPELPEVDSIADELAEHKARIEEARARLQEYAGALSSVIHIECSPVEVFRRYAGLRVDKETGEEFHMVYNPPPPERLPYLVNVDRTRRYTAQLHDVFFEQHRRWELLSRFLSAPPGVCQIANINGETSVEDMCEQAGAAARATQTHFAEGRALFEQMRSAEARIAELKRRREKQMAAREAERRRLAAIYQEKGVALPPVLEQEVNEKLYCEFPREIPEYMLDSVATFSSSYTAAYETIWGDLTALVRLLLDYNTETLRSMDRFWSFPDDKQDKLDRFCAAYNAVPKHLRNRTACKEEMHALTDELNESLYSSVAAKQQACLALIERITKRETYLDGWQASVANTAVSFAQVEVDRFAATANLVLMYFSALTGEPYMFEELDTDVPPLRPPSEVAKEEQQANPKAKERKAQGGKKGHSKAEEPVEKTVEELLHETLDKVISVMSAFIDRFRAVCDINTKGGNQKKGITAATLRAAAVASKCVPVFDAELRSTTERIRAIEHFIANFLREGDGYVRLIKGNVTQSSEVMFSKQASAVNSAIHAIRSAIERERAVPPMHLGCGTFSIDSADASDFANAANRRRSSSAGRGRSSSQQQQQRGSFITDVPLCQHQPLRLVWVQQGLSSLRLQEMIRTFRCVAPNYQLPWTEFALAVRPEDYHSSAAGGGGGAGGRPPKSLRAVFSEFDVYDTGVIDWREWVVHLLFWCCPPTEKAYYTPEITIEQLLETKADVGVDPVDEETFFDLPLFYDAYLGDERLEAYTAALWATFSNPATGTLDPFVLLAFLCADVQPVRGAQKAFYVLSQEGTGRLNAAELDYIFHLRANNPRALGREDPFSRRNIRLLYHRDAADADLTFNDCCGCAIGRKMINSTDAFRRKKFC